MEKLQGAVETALNKVLDWLIGVGKNLLGIGSGKGSSDQVTPRIQSKNKKVAVWLEQRKGKMVLMAHASDDEPLLDKVHALCETTPKLKGMVKDEETKIAATEKKGADVVKPLTAATPTIAKGADKVVHKEKADLDKRLQEAADEYEALLAASGGCGCAKPKKGTCFGYTDRARRYRALRGWQRLGEWRPGQRTLTGMPAREAMRPEPTQLRLVRLQLDYGDGHGVDVQLLRDLEWLRQEAVVPEGVCWLDLTEMGAVGRARVLSVEACPELDEGPGALVTGWFHHWRAQLYDLRVTGEPEPIGVTDQHPFWSVDRNAWVPAIELRRGERLLALDGSMPVVESLTLRDKDEEVFNIEVDGDHCYRVGEQGLLVHNASVGDMPTPPSGATNCNPTVTTATPTEYILTNCLKAQNFIYGELVAGGEVSYIIENLPADKTGCPGYWMFAQMMMHFGSSVNAVQGNWTYGSNLAKINSLTTGGAMTIEQAAPQTFTGTNAGLFGFTKVVLDPANPPQGTPGAYTKIYLKFTK